ncbi:Mut7-C RNAse domain-containing protein [Sulfurimonas sp.]|uniref:Mut7-C RNAse domain-containing protein n=1 Tax=Sulfurimonas sp. TaxID=2022749 RepID=UPI00356677BA
MPKFIADCHLGKLSKYLRVMGFDTLFFSTIDDNDLIELAKEGGRIILTRDKVLHNRKDSPTFYLESVDNLEQLRALQREYNLKSYALVPRCVVCNSELNSIQKSKIEDRLPPRVKKYFSEFEICNICDRIYWQGDHYKRMLLTINKI